MNPVKRSLIALHITVVLLGATALFSHLIPLPATTITLGRSLFAVFVLLAFVYMSGENMRLHQRRDYWIAFSLGILMTLHWVTYFAAMQYSSVAVGMIALFTFPVITVLLEPLFEATRLHWQDLVSAVVVFVGIVFVVPEPSLDNDITLGVLIGIGSAGLYALRNLVHRQYFSHYPGAKAMAWQILVIAICMLPFEAHHLTALDPDVWWQLLLLGTIFTALPHALIATSLRHLRAKTFSLIACMQPMYGVILAVIILNETPTWKTLLGGVLVTSASVYETLQAHRRVKLAAATTKE